MGHKSRAIVGVAGGSSRTQGRGKSSETTQVKDTRWALQRQQDQSKAHVIEGFVVDPSTDSQVKLVVHHLARPQHVIHVNMSFTLQDLDMSFTSLHLSRHSHFSVP